MRATLLKTSLAVSDQPEVWQWVLQGERAFIAGIEGFHELGPQHAARPHLGHLHEEVHADRPEEGDARRELVDGETSGETGADVFEAVGERVGEFEIGRRAGLLHVIAGHRDRIELRHVAGGERENVGNDAQRWCGRIDVGVANHELLQNVVLNGSGEPGGRHALFFGGDDVERQDRQHGAVHGHRHRRAVERNAVEQDAHVVDGIDRHSGHADVAGHALMVGIVAAVRGEIEGDGQARLPAARLRR